MKIRLLLIGLFTLFTSLLSAQHLYINNSQYYYYCNGVSCLSHNTHLVYKGIYQYDTLVQKKAIKQEISITEHLSNKRGAKLSHKQVSQYDTLGRTIKTEYTNRRGSTYSIYDYSKPRIIIYKTENYFKQAIYNDSNRLINRYNERTNSKGKVKSQRLTTYTYNNYKWNSTSRNSYKNMDTTKLRYSYKRYYQNDTGDMLKMEYYKKGKINKTIIYECSLVDKAPPIKDTTVICSTKATDDRGYTYHTTFSESNNKNYKHTSVFNPSNILVERSTYIINEGNEILSYLYKVNTDSAYTKSLNYSKNLKKVKRSVYQVTYFAKDKSKSYTQIKISRNNNKKVDRHNIYYKYYINGLLKETTDEIINAKGKLINNSKKSYYYTYFNE